MQKQFSASFFLIQRRQARRIYRRIMASTPMLELGLALSLALFVLAIVSAAGGGR